MEYIDGFVTPVQNSKKEEYVEFSKRAAEVFKDHGALRCVECWGDDVPPGELTSFPASINLGEDETVVFSWISWPSKEARDTGNEKTMADPRLNDMQNPPFDGKRMIYGGFQMVMDE